MTGLRQAAVLALIPLCSGCVSDTAAMITSTLTLVALTTPMLPPERRGKAVPPAPVYCYHTLGRTDCHAAPLGGGEAPRLVGYVGPAPAAAE